MMNKKKQTKQEKIVFSINIEADLYHKLQALADEDDRTKNYFVVKALKQFLSA